jgi:hypothetical protein
MDGSGNAVVAYEKLVGPDFDIKAVRVSSTGAVSGEFTIRATGLSEFVPKVAVKRTGGSFVVAYNTFSTSGAVDVGIDEINASNTNLAHFTFTGQFREPALSIDTSGNYLLTYTAGPAGGDTDIHGRYGQLSTAPAAKNLALTNSVKVGQLAILSGQLVDGDGDTKLKLTVNWGDGSQARQSQPGTKAFAVNHKYAHAGTYTVRVTWTDSTGLSNSRDLTIKVAK